MTVFFNSSLSALGSHSLNLPSFLFNVVSWFCWRVLPFQDGKGDYLGGVETARRGIGRAPQSTRAWRLEQAR